MLTPGARRARCYAGAMTDPARVSIARTSPRDVGYREVFVELDGESLPALRAGAALTREVAPGPHVLRVHNTLFRKRLAIELRPGEHARFLVVNRSGFATTFLNGILGGGPLYLDVEREP